MSMFEKFEEMLETEKRQIEIGKQQFYKEKLNLQQQLGQVQNMLQNVKAQGQVSEDAKTKADLMERVLSPTTPTAMRETPSEGVEHPDGNSNVVMLS